MATPTIQQSGGSASSTDPWVPEGATSPATDATGSSSSGPTIMIETAYGHRLVLTYEDLVLAAMLIGLTVQVWRWADE